MKGKEQASDHSDRGQMAVSPMQIAFIVAIAVGAIMAAFLIPVAVDEVEGNTTTVHTSAVADGPVDINGALTGNVTASTSGTSATIELNNSGTTESQTINVGANATYSTLPDGDVTVGVESADGTNATFNATYARDYAFSDGAKSMWGLVGLALVLAVILFLLGKGTTAFDRM